MSIYTIYQVLTTETRLGRSVFRLSGRLLTVGYLPFLYLAFTSFFFFFFQMFFHSCPIAKNVRVAGMYVQGMSTYPCSLSLFHHHHGYAEGGNLYLVHLQRLLAAGVGWQRRCEARRYCMSYSGQTRAPSHNICFDGHHG